MERKKELRKWIKEVKAQYPLATLIDISVDIIARLEQLPAFQEAQTVLLYHSLKDEVNTHEFIHKWSKKKRIILPIVTGEILELCLYTGTDDLTISSYGIAEPTGTRFHEYNSIDLAVIPGMAFDSKGHRLGRGKGFYDKLLPHIPAPKVGICFPFQLVDEVPADELDISMDLIITSTENQLSDPELPVPNMR